MEYQDLFNVYQGNIEDDYLDKNGHVNVMWYTHMLDCATQNLFESFTGGEDYYQKLNKGMFALEQHTRYMAELHVGDEVQIFARVLDRSNKRIHFMLFMHIASGNRLSATGEFVGMHMNLTTRRPEAFPQLLTHSIDKLIADQADLNWQAPTCGSMAA